MPDRSVILPRAKYNAKKSETIILKTGKKRYIFQNDSKNQNAHEPNRRKSPGAHTLWTSSYDPGLPFHVPGMPPGAIQDPLEAEFVVKLEV